MRGPDIVLLILLAIVNIPVYMYAFRVTFGNVEGLNGAMRDATSDQLWPGVENPFWSWTASFNDQYNNWMANFLLLLFAAVCIGSVLAEYYLLVRFVLNRPPFWA